MAGTRRTVLITGASGGLGRAILAHLHDRGWRVFAGVRSPTDSTDLAMSRPGVTLVQLDIRDEKSIEAAREQLGDALADDGLDALVNNAGLSVDGPLELLTPDRLRQQFEVNVIGQIAVTQAFLPLLRAARGRIVNIGGAAGRLPMPMFGALSASKAALDAASDAFRMELRHQGVRVCYVEPGALRTELFAKSAKAARDDGFAGPPEIQGRYAVAMAKAAGAMAKQRMTPVERAAKTIHTALTARRPKARYPVGREARYLFPIVRGCPVRLRDRLLLSSLGLDRTVFISQDTGS